MTQRFGGLYSPLKGSEYFRLVSIVDSFDEGETEDEIREMSVPDMITMIEEVKEEIKLTFRGIEGGGGLELAEAKRGNREDIIFLSQIEKKLKSWQRRFGTT